MKKSTLVIAAAIALCTTLISCGGGNNGNQTSNNTQASEVTTADETSLACKTFFEEDARRMGAKATVTFEGNKINCIYERDFDEEELAKWGTMDELAKTGKDLMIGLIVSFGDDEGIKALKDALLAGKTIVVKTKYNDKQECEYSINKADLVAAMEKAANKQSKEE